MAAAVGSLIILRTSRLDGMFDLALVQILQRRKDSTHPAIIPASLVDKRCESLKLCASDKNI